MTSPWSASERYVISPNALTAAIAVLQERGFETWGPVGQEGALAYEPVDSLDDLARGISDEQAPGCYREDHNLLDGSATRTRVWDSCFSLQYSYIHGGSVRSSAAARYCQWLTHKLASWQDQFGQTGCVGCGRCITWCPVGIDITREAERIRSTASWGGI